MTRLSNQFESSIVFDRSEFDLAKFDCTSKRNLKNVLVLGRRTGAHCDDIISFHLKSGLLKVGSGLIRGVAYGGHGLIRRGLVYSSLT